MAPIFQDPISRRLVLWGAVFVMIACVLPTKSSFVISGGGHRRVIARQDNPGIYWGAEAGVLLVAGSLWGYAFYRTRKK
jgi:hypothetical protein